MRNKKNLSLIELFIISAMGVIVFVTGSLVISGNFSLPSRAELIMNQSSTWYVPSLKQGTFDFFTMSPTPTPMSLVETETETASLISGDCTYTQGYWKNHPKDWPLTKFSLGNVQYDQAELLEIFNTSVTGNDLIALAHQLIASKLNVAYGASKEYISDDILYADTLIGDLIVPPVGDGNLSSAEARDVLDDLDEFNNGLGGPPHCSEPISDGSASKSGLSGLLDRIKKFFGF